MLILNKQWFLRASFRLSFTSRKEQSDCSDGEYISEGGRSSNGMR